MPERFLAQIPSRFAPWSRASVFARAQRSNAWSPGPGCNTIGGRTPGCERTKRRLSTWTGSEIFATNAVRGATRAFGARVAAERVADATERYRALPRITIGRLRSNQGVSNGAHGRG